MGSLKADMEKGKKDMEEIQRVVKELDNIRSMITVFGLIIPLFGALLAVIGCKLSKHKCSCFITFLMFFGSIFLWVAFGVHAPIGRIGDDLCYTIDQVMCEHNLAEGICFLANGAQGALDTTRDTLGSSLGYINNASVVYGLPQLKSIDPTQE